MEIVEEIKQKTEKDFPITCRLNVHENMKNGYSIDDEDPKEAARLLEAFGIECINCYTGWHEAPVPTIQRSVESGAFAYLAENVKDWVNIPVIAANRINDPFLGEKIISDGKADLIGMGRALIADPYILSKAMDGREDEIVPCIACTNCLADILKIYKKWGRKTKPEISCTVNPEVGREGEISLKPAEKTENIIVVGGGPAGLETSIIAASRGHNVTLYEKREELGGRLNVASIPPYKKEVADLKESLITRARKENVQLKLSTPVDSKIIKKEEPDVLVLATGGVPIVPDIKGIQENNVTTAEKVLNGEKEVGEKVIVAGGGTVGCETAEFLANKGKEIHIVEMLDRTLNDEIMTYRPFFYQRLKRNPSIGIETNAKVVEITEGGVKAEKDGSSHFIKGDSVVLAMGYKPKKHLAEELRSEIKELHLIGDSKDPRTIKEAITEGFNVGQKI